MNPIPIDALSQQITWKSTELLNAAKGLVKAAVERSLHGIDSVSTDDVEACYRPADSTRSPGIMGSACCTLRAAGVIADRVERVRSIRPEANGRKIGTYRLVSVGVGLSFLKRYGITVTVQQMELAI